MLYIALAVILAYLIGSINFAVIFSKIFIKKDVRDFGSGNAGATNVLRTAGILPGILTFLFDAMKGFVACYVGKSIVLNLADFSDNKMGIYCAFACGLACMLGHVFPIFFHFKGGKGVATAVGIFAVCCPIAIIIGLAVFVILAISTKIVSISSLCATVTVVVCSAIFYNRDASLIPQIILSVMMGVLVFVKHSENIKRLLKGEEKKLGRK